MIDQAIATKFLDMLKKLGVSDSTCELVAKELIGEEKVMDTPEAEELEEKVMEVEVMKVDKKPDLDSAKSSLLKRMLA
mgnify:FL=1